MLLSGFVKAIQIYYKNGKNQSKRCKKSGGGDIFIISCYICMLQANLRMERNSRHKAYTINVRGKLMSFDTPAVMGILNVTPDSFYGESRLMDPGQFLERARRMIDEGASILDVGACSTRPGSTPVTEKEELERLHAALSLLDKELPDAVVSIDTFRGAVALECAREHNVSIINDVSAFEWDGSMFPAIAELNIPYVLTHSCGPAGNEPGYTDFLPQVLKALAGKMWQLRQAGVKDVIVDPGFGFGKSLEQNYSMLANLGGFSLLDAPLLVGVSRKSMINRCLGCAPEDALMGTVALNMAALMAGAHILRVHDVKEAVDTVRLFKAIDDETIR